MQIQSIRYVSDAQSEIIITLADGGEVVASWPCQTWHAGPINAWLAAGGEIAPAAVPSLAESQAAAIVEVNRQAEALRMQMLTPGQGQAMEYLATQHEVDAYAAEVAGGGTPQAADYPFLAAEATARGVDLATAYAGVAAEVAAWRQLGGAIKAVRRGAKLAMDAATTADQVAAILAGVAWPQVPA